MIGNLNKDFIEVHALVDGCVCAIRSDCIESVESYEEEKGEYGSVKPAHTEIYYSGHSLEVVESYEEIMKMIWKAEL